MVVSLATQPQIEVTQYENPVSFRYRYRSYSISDKSRGTSHLISSTYGAKVLGRNIFLYLYIFRFLYEISIGFRIDISHENIHTYLGARFKNYPSGFKSKNRRLKPPKLNLFRININYLSSGQFITFSFMITIICPRVKEKRIETYKTAKRQQ